MSLCAGAAGRKSDAVLAAQARLRQRVEGQILAWRRSSGADEQVGAAQDRLQSVLAENQVKVATAEEAIVSRKRERAEALAGLAMVVNDEQETAGLAGVIVGEVRAARRAVPAARAREVAAQGSASNRSKKPAKPAGAT